MPYFKQDSSRLGATQSMTLGSSAGSSTTVFGSQTYQIRVVSTQQAKVLVDQAPSVSSTTILQTGANLPPNWVEFINVTPGQRLSALTTSTAADMTVTEVG